MPPKIWNMYRGVRRNVCLQNNIRLQRWMTHIYRLHYMWTYPFSIWLQFGFFPQGDDHVIKMESHVRHTNMVSLNRFWNMLYLTFHGFESLNSREIRLASSSYEFLGSKDCSASLVLQTVYKRVYTVIQMNEF